MCPFLSRIKRAHSYRALFHSGLDNHSIRRNHTFVCSRQLLPVQLSIVQLGLLYRLMRVGGSERLTEDSASSRLTMSRSHVLSLPRKHISLIQYILSTMTIMIGAGMTSAKKTQKSKSGSREGTKQKSQTLKHFQFCPVDLYLLCIISFPKHSLGKWTV